MARAGIPLSTVTITTDDERLEADKPTPHPYLLAAEDLGLHARHQCVVFEDSPAGIRAGLEAGAIVVAVCTGHAREQIAHCGAHYVVDTMEQVGVVCEDGGLKFTIAYPE